MVNNKTLEILDADNIEFNTNLLDNEETDNESIVIDDSTTDINKNANAIKESNEEQQSNEEESNEEQQSNEEESNEEESNEEQVIEPNEMVLDEPGFLYNILHMLDDIYVYGRTVIENNYFNLADNADFNLVYPYIYIGNYSTSTNLELLKGLGITHILSVIPTFNPPYPENFTYLHIPAYDDDSQNMVPWFEKTNAFIQNVLTQRGKLLLHCMVGRSRSVCIFIAFLIHIIQGKFNQSLVDTTSINDVSNEIEYNKFGKLSRNTISNLDGIRNNNGENIQRDKNINNENDKNDKNDKNNDISRIEYVKPQLSNKYKSFMIYKKQTMINEIERLIEIYNISREIFNLETETSITARESFFKDLLAYVVKYRSIACPNDRFRTQLISLF